MNEPLTNEPARTSPSSAIPLIPKVSVVSKLLVMSFLVLLLVIFSFLILNRKWEGSQLAHSILQRTDQDNLAMTPPTDIKPSLDQLTRRLDRLEENFHNNETSSRDEDLQKEIDHLHQELASLTLALNSFDQQLKTVRESSQKQDAGMKIKISRILAAYQLKEALSTNKPYETELTLMRTASANSDEFINSFNTLSLYAHDGVPTVADLHERFDKDAQSARRASEAVQAHTWFDKIMIELGGVITIHHLHESYENSNLFEKIAVDLTQGDLNTVIDDFHRLPTEAQGPLQNWFHDVEHRHALDQAISDLIHKLSLSE